MKKLINHFIYLCLQFSLAVTPATGWTSQQKNPPDDPATGRLAQNQAKIAQAYGKYFDALQSSRPEAISSAKNSLNQAHENMNQWISERRTQELNQIFSRVYFSDGTSLPEKEYLKNPELYENAISADGRQASVNDSEDEEDSQSTKNSASQENKLNRATEPLVGTSESKGSGNQNSSGRPDWVLDGSQTPRELIFSTKSVKPSPAKRAPAQLNGKPASKTQP